MKSRLHKLAAWAAPRSPALIGLAGVALIVGGIACWSPPAAAIVAGVVLLVDSVEGMLRKRRQ